jgi:gamma-glutamyltranspeptidase/glutathione hydrolase
MLSRRTFRALFFFSYLLFITFPCPAQQLGTGAVVSDTIEATKVGMEILEQGGNAVDAAVATAFSLGVVDPASSGIGGGGFMVIYQAKERKVHALDFRETAPAAAHRDLYVKDGKVVSELSLKGPLAVAVPGEIAGLSEALKRFGTLPLARVIAPAIRQATRGFPVGPDLRRAVERHLSTIRSSPGLARIFLKADGAPYGEGEKISQPELGATLEAVAREGPQVFYRGRIAQTIADILKSEGGILTLEDLKSYKPAWRPPLIGKYRNRTVVTMPPPSSGGVVLLQVLRVLESYPVRGIPHNSPTYLHLLIEAMKHAFADRARYLGDPDFVEIPIQKLTSREYAAWIRAKISPDRTHPPSAYGFAVFHEEKGGTTHLSVVDRAGNAVSCTLTINTQFGSKVYVAGTGIILNNEMDDFSSQPGAANVYRLIGGDANSIQPKKRPLSSMTPTIVLEGDRPFLTVGASGGPRIISATLQTLLNALDFGMPVDKAVASPRVHHQWTPNELLVENEMAASVKISLERRGHAIKERDGLGVVQAILVKEGNVSTQADPRKEQRIRAE